ncbi:MAG: DNA replication/repair protein RecF [Acidimicrobiales bacterium]
MQLRRLWLRDFRSYAEAEVPFGPGLTAIVGANGEGKTNLLEAIAYLATLGSFRGAPTEALVRTGATEAVVRAEGEREGRQVLVEAEVAAGGRGRVQVNKQRLRRARDLLGYVRVTVFSPDDLELVKGGPEQRRRYLDATLVALHPRHDAVQRDLERILRQRNALLRQAGGRLTAEVETTLDVWDDKLATTGAALAHARQALVDDLGPLLAAAYVQVARRDTPVTATYRGAWQEAGLATALADARRDDLRRGVTTVGPHRDELGLRIDGLPARTHASQGEQRSLAWALRLASHLLVRDAVGSAPVLLLDDVFSELDPGRSQGLLDGLPAGQTVLTTAGGLPADAAPDVVVRVGAGQVAVVSG